MIPRPIQLQSDPAPAVRIATVIVLAICVAAAHLAFFRPFFTALIFDEVAHLVSAKYVFSNIDLGFFGWTMKGHSLLLYLLALPFGGLDRYSPKEVYDLSWIANIVMSALFVPLTYAFLRDFRIGFFHALLGAATVASLPLFYIYSPLAMTELFFASLCMLYLFVLLRFFDRPLPSGLPYLLAALCVTAALTATKAAATYYLLAVCVLSVFLYRINARTVSFVVLSATVIYLVRQTRMMFGYNLELSLGAIWPHLGVLLIGITASLCISLVYFAPLFEPSALGTLAPRGPTPPAEDRRRRFLARMWMPAVEQSDSPGLRGFNAFMVATFGFLLPAIAVSSLFHAMIDRFTNYRTVASVIPVFLAATIALFLAPRAEETVPARPGRLSVVIRVLMTAAILTTIFLMKALSRYFTVDNFFDFVTILPVYDYMTQPFLSRATLWLLGLSVAFTLVSLLSSQAMRMAGLIAINVGLLGCYLMSPWSTDKDIGVFHSANLRMFEAVKGRAPEAVLLLDTPSDVQWLHFGYPYAWDNAAATTATILGPGNEALVARGIGVVRFPVVNADALHTEPAGRQKFLSYDLATPRLHDVERMPVIHLGTLGGAHNFNPPELFGTTPFTYAQTNMMFGLLILPADRVTRVTLWAPPVAGEAQYTGCALVANKSRWPLEIVSPPTAQANEWMLAADVAPDTALLGVLRLDCPNPAVDPTGKLVTLPLSGFAVTELPKR